MLAQIVGQGVFIAQPVANTPAAVTGRLRIDQLGQLGVKEAGQRQDLANVFVQPDLVGVGDGILDQEGYFVFDHGVDHAHIAHRPIRKASRAANDRSTR